MSYVEDNLMPNEKVLYTARIHPAVFLPAVVAFLGCVAFAFLSSGSPREQDPLATVFLCFTGILFLYSILLGIQAIILMLTTEFAVTNRRIIAKNGFIRRHTLEMLLAKVESVSVRQDILGRLLNFGTLTVTGTGGTHESFKPIVEPLTVRKKMNQILEHFTAPA